MAEMGIWGWAAATGLAFVLSVCVLWLVSALPVRRAGQHGAEPQGDDRATDRATVSHFLFRDDILIDHDGPAPPTMAGATTDWQDLACWLHPRFTRLPRRPEDLAEGQILHFGPLNDSDTARVDVIRDGQLTRLALAETSPPEPAQLHLLHRERAHLATLAQALDCAPNPCWVTARDGTPPWCNQAALALPDAHMTLLQGCAAPTGDSPQSERMHTAKGQPDDTCYDVLSRRGTNGVLYHARDITPLERAESARRAFVQTLTRTFANLTIGLAVFDNDHRLAIFNPALLDMTGLPPDLLTGQPPLMTFFDRLRDRQVMPEPKSYTDWRSQITQMVETARDRLSVETWTLPDGRTLRVTGRPHPDGSVAFLFEDISESIGLTRAARARLDLRQAALDRVEEGVLLLAPDQSVLFCNAACRSMLAPAGDAQPPAPDLQGALDAARACLPDPEFWRLVEADITAGTPQGLRHTVLTTPQGTSVAVRLEGLPGGGWMLGLRPCDRPAGDSANDMAPAQAGAA